jgi:hypothetical protein
LLGLGRAGLRLAEHLRGHIPRGGKAQTEKIAPEPDGPSVVPVRLSRDIPPE